MKEDDSEPEPHQRRPFYHPKFLSDIEYWTKTAPPVARRLTRIIAETLQTPFTGIGKPEPLRNDLKGQWSRRLTKSDRVVYIVSADVVEFFSARNHYRKRRR